MAVTAMSFVSCDDDEIAQTLDGVWEGQVQAYRWNLYQYVDIQFSREGYADGYGIERDYMSNGDRYDSPFTFKVNNGRIFMEYEDGSRVAIRNYTLTENRFSGEFCEWIGSYSVGDVIARFDFYKVTDWRHIRFNNYHYTAKPANNATIEKIPASSENEKQAAETDK